MRSALESFVRTLLALHVAAIAFLVFLPRVAFAYSTPCAQASTCSEGSCLSGKCTTKELTGNTTNCTCK